MTCPRCGANLIEIRMGGAALTLRSCSNCDGRWWSRHGEPVDRGDAIALVAGGRQRVGAAQAG